MKFKKSTRFLLTLCLMTLTLLCGENKAWGQAATSTLTFKKKCGGSGTANDRVKWTVESDAAESDYDKSKGIHYGTGKKAVSYLQLSTSGITGVVQKIVVNASGASGTSAKLDVTVNGKSFGDQKTITTTATDYTFEGTESGKIIVKLSQTSATIALYVKSISVTYQKETSTPAPTFSLTEGTYNGPQHVTITAPDKYTGGIVYTTDGNDPTGPSRIDYTPAGIDITTTTTLRAVARNSEGNFSGEATAKYTITYNEPTFSHATGTYYGDQSVTISVADLGTGSILYTTDGTDPKTDGTKYTEAIPLPVGTKRTLKAVAKYGEGLFSKVTEATYDIQKVSPSFYQRVTSAAELTANETYLIVCESKSKAFGKISNSKGSPQHVTITGDKIYLSAAGTGTPIEFILEVSEKNYKLKNASTGNYLNFNSSTSPDITETASGTALSISFDNAEGNVKIAGANMSTRQLIYRASTYNVFGNYGNDNVSASGYNKVYLYKKHVVKEFSDTENLATSLPTSPLADQTVILKRNVYSGWNTFCVPFALTQEQLEEAYGNGAVAKYLSGVTTDGAAATLHFTPEEKGGIEANKAYLLYLTADVTEAKTFSDVTLQPAGECTTTVSTAGGDYTFQGILAPTALETNDRQYFLNSAGTYFVLPSNSTSAMKATRAYIIVPDAPGSAQSRQYSFDFNGTTTGIDNVNISGLEDGGAWYTISGIRVNRPAAKGVYIHNGRKVIVK